MIKVIMHGCNGKMGQVITNLVAADEEACIVAGIDARDDGHNEYPVFTDIDSCDVEADAVIDFSVAPAVDKLLEYCEKKNLPCVLCTTGLTEEQLAKVKQTSEKVAVLKSANMSLGINLLLKLLKEASGVLAQAGFDIEIVEKHHNLKKDAPSGTAIMIAEALNGELDNKMKYVYDRHNVRKAREADEIGIATDEGLVLPQGCTAFATF